MAIKVVLSAGFMPAFLFVALAGAMLQAYYRLYKRQIMLGSMAKSSTSLKKGDVINPKGNNGERPEAHRAKERYIQALMAAATEDELVSDLLLIRSGDKNPLEFHRLLAGTVSSMKIHSPEEKEEHKARLRKLNAETKAIEDGRLSKVIDEERAQIKIDDMIKQISE